MLGEAGDLVDDACDRDALFVGLRFEPERGFRRQPITSRANVRLRFGGVLKNVAARFTGASLACTDAIQLSYAVTERGQARRYFPNRISRSPSK